MIAERDGITHAREGLERAPGSGDREVVLARLVEKAVTALESLRQITRGIYPTQLTSYGLGPALAAHLGRGGQAGGLQVEPSAEGVRFGRRTEAAAYFCYLEASDDLEPPVEVTLAVVEGELRMRVEGNAGSARDDRRFSDRLEPLGGTARWAASGNRMVLSITLPVPDAKSTRMHMKMNGVEHDMLMPGMLTDEEMAELDKARGAEFDRLFLNGMIKHHQGAIDMVNDLFKAYGAAQDDTIYKFASDVFADQSIEIGVMQRMLESAGGRP